MTNVPAFRQIGTPLDVPDADLSQLNRRLGVPALVPVAAPPAKPTSPTRAINVHLPEYVLKALKAKANDADASVRYLILKAIADAGVVTVDPADLVPDARRTA